MKLPEVEGVLSSLDPPSFDYEDDLLPTLDGQRDGPSIPKLAKASLGGLLLPLLLACDGAGDRVEAQASRVDTVPAAAHPPADVDQDKPRTADPRIPLEEGQDRALELGEMGYNFGSSDAPVKVLELSDFGCGYCRRFHEETFPGLLQSYMDAGLVEWKFIPFVLGRFPNGMEAATAAECAGEQDRFFPMQTRLFAEQGGWRGTDDPQILFSSFAAEEGLDVERFDGCMKEGWRDTRVRQSIRLGQQLGVRGTPTFFVDGRPIPGALPLEDFRRVLNEALVRRGVTPPGGGLDS